MQNRMYRSRQDKVIGGVCGGLGEYFSIDPTIIRLIWAISVLSGFGFLAYIIAWIAIPEKPYAPLRKTAPANSLVTQYPEDDNAGYTDSSAAYSDSELNSQEEYIDDYPNSGNTLTNNTSKVIGIALIIFGGSYIFRKFFGFINIDERLIFSAFLILAGLYMMTKKKN